jgi:hypothetical protein
MINMLWRLVFLISFLPASWAQIPALDLMGDQPEVKIPFTYYYNFILVDIRLKGVLPMRMIFDTGAENTVVFDKTLTDLLGMTYDKRVVLRGSDQTQDIPAFITRQAPVFISRKGLTTMDLIVLEEDIYQLDQVVGRDIHGILGANLFKGFIVKIDYRKRYITIIRPEEMPELGKQWEALPIKVINSKPYLSTPTVLQDDRTADLTYLIDTGAGLTSMLHNNSHPDIQLPEAHIKGYLGAGIGGKLEGYMARLPSLKIGSHEFNNLILGYQTLDSAYLENVSAVRNGILGNPLLRKFEIIIDYNREVMYIKPSKFYKKAFETDRSGLYMFASGRYHNQFFVRHVIPNSPAWKAGLRPGDKITKINGWSTSFFDLDRIVRKFQKKAGTKVKVTYRRNQVKYKTRLVLQDLI